MLAASEVPAPIPTTPTTPVANSPVRVTANDTGSSGSSSFAVSSGRMLSPQALAMAAVPGGVGGGGGGSCCCQRGSSRSAARRAARRRNVSRVYADVNASRPKAWWDYEHTPMMAYGSQDDYQIVRHIGRGKYSEVFEGVALTLGTKCTIKVLKPVRVKKIYREVKVLRNLLGAPNIVQLLDVVCEPYTRTPCLVHEYVENVDFRELYPTLSDYDVRYYMFQLLRALDYCHSNGIMHRDVKPHNVMIDPVRRQLRLIDWGLAEFYHPGMEYNVRVASRYFKGPELLVDIQDYDYSLDMWSFGCVFAALIFRREPFFRGKDNHDQLVRIVHVLGSADFFAFAEKYQANVSSQLVRLLSNHKRRTWQMYINSSCLSRCTPDALELLNGLLVYDMPARLTAKEAMAMRYFDPVRSEALASPSAAPVPSPLAADPVRASPVPTTPVLRSSSFGADTIPDGMHL